MFRMLAVFVVLAMITMLPAATEDDKLNAFFSAFLDDDFKQRPLEATRRGAVNVRNAARRIEQIPRVLAAARASLANPPRVMVETAIRQNRGSLAFYESGIYEIAGEAPQFSDLRHAALPAVEALKQHQ